MSAADSRHPLQALGLAIVAELALLTSAAAILALPATTKPALSEPVPIVLANEEQPAVKPPQPKPEPPQPKPKLLTPPPKAMPQPPPPPEAPKELRQAMPVAAEPSAFTEPLPPPSVTAPTPTESADKAKPSAEYAAKVHAAVQAAHYYPPAAAALRYSGRVRVEFRLRDKIASESRLLVASGFGIIDRAALQAVQSAQYPEPPQELKGAELIYQVWVEFNR